MKMTGRGTWGGRATLGCIEAEITSGGAQPPASKDETRVRTVAEANRVIRDISLLRSVFRSKDLGEEQLQGAMALVKGSMDVEEVVWQERLLIRGMRKGRKVRTLALPESMREVLASLSGDYDETEVSAILSDILWKWGQRFDQVTLMAIVTDTLEGVERP